MRFNRTMTTKEKDEIKRKARIFYPVGTIFSLPWKTSEYRQIRCVTGKRFLWGNNNNLYIDKINDETGENGCVYLEGTWARRFSIFVLYSKAILKQI